MSNEYTEARRIAKKYAVDEEQTLSMLRDEAESVISSSRANGSRRPSWDSAVRVAAESIDLWLGGPAYAYHPESTDGYAKFVAEHRRAYVWASLVRDTFREPPRG